MKRGLTTGLCIGCLMALALAAVLLLAPTAEAYETYGDEGVGNCGTCHGNFRTGTGDLHNLHIAGGSEQLTGNCSLCHTGSGRNNPFIMWSDPNVTDQPELSGFGCVGCHGRDYGETIEADYGFGLTGLPKMSGYGLRRHHQNNGVTECISCHGDMLPFPEGPDGTPYPGNITQPPYYARTDVRVTGACNADGSEDSLQTEPNGDDEHSAQAVRQEIGRCTRYDEHGDDENRAHALKSSVACTVDSCDEANGVVNTPDDALCDNGLFCDGAETCDAVNDCQAGTPPCDPATQTCDEAGDSCEPIGCTQSSDCTDGLVCTDDVCDTGTGECSNPAVDPDDGVACTVDSCDEANGVVNTPDDAACDNGLFCDGAETCDAVNDCQAGTPPCDPATQTCNEAGGVCEPIGCQSDAECNNGLFCDGTETCDTGTGECLSGTPVDCSDGVGCTVDSCNEGTGSCDNTPDNTVCDNGLFCDGAETCDVVNDCQTGSPIDCSDGVSCTVDSCNEGTGSCDNAPDDTVCDNGLFCDGAETCDPINDCQAGTPPCDPATQTCDEAGGTCEPVGCTMDADCDNGLFCDGTETCDTGTGECLPGTPVVCGDGVSCTVDSCNEGTDSCDYVPDDAFCDDGLFCTGAEFCDPTADCSSAGDPCAPGETCNEATDTCDLPDLCAGVICDDGVFCNGVESCDPSTGQCVAGMPPSCDDGLACSVDFCDPTLDQCVNNDSGCFPGECDDSDDSDCDEDSDTDSDTDKKKKKKR